MTSNLGCTAHRKHLLDPTYAKFVYGENARGRPATHRLHTQVGLEDQRNEDGEEDLDLDGRLEDVVRRELVRPEALVEHDEAEGEAGRHHDLQNRAAVRDDEHADLRSSEQFSPF